MPEKILYLTYTPSQALPRKRGITILPYKPRLHYSFISVCEQYGFVIEKIALDFDLPKKSGLLKKLIIEIQLICNRINADYIFPDTTLLNVLHLCQPSLPINLITNVFNSLGFIDSCVIIDEDSMNIDARDSVYRLLEKLNALTIISKDVSRWECLSDTAFFNFGLPVTLTHFDSEKFCVIKQKGACCVLDFSAEHLCKHFVFLQSLPANTVYCDFTLEAGRKLHTFKSMRRDITYKAIYERLFS